MFIPIKNVIAEGKFKFIFKKQQKVKPVLRGPVLRQVVQQAEIEL